MRRICLALTLSVVVLAASCKKNTDAVEPTPVDNSKLSSENSLLSFSVPGQFSAATIDPITRTISAMVPFTVDRSAISVTFSVSKDATVSINNISQTGSTTVNLSQTSTLKVVAANGNVSTWTVSITTDMELYGLGSSVTSYKSFSKGFEWYYDQGTSGTFWSINCGPAVTTMAAKWADSTYNLTVEDARKVNRPEGGWWYTNEIVKYLNDKGISTNYTPLPDNYQTLKKYIDKNYLVILCLDNYYLVYNADPVKRINKYYQVGAKGSGHFIVLKGYKQVDGKVFFEAYDPWSIGAKYTSDGTFKGKSRYYTSDELEQATGVWWDYGILVAPKGKTATLNDASGLKVQSISNIPAQKGA